MIKETPEVSETISEHETVEERVVESAAERMSDEQLISMLVERARSDGLQLTGEGGLLQQLTKRVLESALEDSGSIDDLVSTEPRFAMARSPTGPSTWPWLSRRGHPRHPRDLGR